MSTCDKCCFSETVRIGHDINPETYCNRYPPTAHPIPTHNGIGAVTVRPKINYPSKQSCGEFKPIPVK